MSNEMSLAQAIADRFESCNREQLEAFATQMDITFHPSSKDDTLRGKMVDKLGLNRPAVEAETVSDNSPTFSDILPDTLSNADLNQLMRLNLSSSGVWEGRRRIIVLAKPENIKGRQPHPVTWSKSQTFVPWNTKVTVPYPVYNILKNTKYFDYEQERTSDRKGTPFIRNHKVEMERFALSDFGDDPETLMLPTSQKEQFRKVAEATNYFEGWSRQMLARVARRLRVRYPRGEEVPAIVEAILLKLGISLDYIEEMDGEPGIFLKEEAA